MSYAVSITKRKPLTLEQSARDLLNSMSPGRSTTFAGMWVTRWTRWHEGRHITEYEFGGKGLNARRYTLDEAVTHLARVAEALPRGGRR